MSTANTENRPLCSCVILVLRALNKALVLPKLLAVDQTAKTVIVVDVSLCYRTVSDTLLPRKAALGIVIVFMLLVIWVVAAISIRFCAESVKQIINTGDSSVCRLLTRRTVPCVPKAGRRGRRPLRILKHPLPKQRVFC